AYGGGSGSPKNWDADPRNRKLFLPYTQAANGHAYATSYTQSNGSFVGNLDVYAPVEDGWGRDMINTEFGAVDKYHADWDNLGERQRQSGLYDRVLRAHLAFCDYFCDYAATGDDDGFSMFVNGYPDGSWTKDPASLRAHITPPLPNGAPEDTRLKIFRRYALAYCTHGAPLPYTFTKPGQVADQLVYFRAVNTAGMEPLPVSHAASRKILLNFVNFDTEHAHTMTVRVLLPRRGTYWGERFGPGDTYAAAESPVRLAAAPAITFTETLPPGESAQYILDDAPSYVVNGDFDAAPGVNPRGWCTNQGDNHSSGAVFAERAGPQGTPRLTFRAAKPYTAKALQTVTGIPNGTYVLSARVTGSGGQSACALSASGSGGPPLSQDILASLSPGRWSAAALRNIAVTNHQCTIALTVSDTGGHWASFDHVDLRPVQPSAAIAPRLARLPSRR